jgi:hypothetical protein
MIDRMKTTRDARVFTLVKGSERYVFIFDEANRAEILQQIRRLAANPELGFTWYDATVVSQRVRILTNLAPAWKTL